MSTSSAPFGQTAATHAAALKPKIFPSYTVWTWQYVVLAICLLGASVITFIGIHLDRGMELSDEGVYFFSISNPFMLLSKVSDFATPLHYVFTALGNSFYALRVLSFSILLTMSGLFSYMLLKVGTRYSPLPFSTCSAACIALGSACCAYYAIWVPTPSYNWTALVGILGVLSSLLTYTYSLHAPIFPRQRPTLRKVSLCTLAAMGLLAFIGKGTVGVGIAILALFWVVCTRGKRSLQHRFYDIAASGLLALVLLFLYVTLISEGITVLTHKILLSIQLFDNTYGLQQTLQQYLQFFFPLPYIPVLLTYLGWVATGLALRRQHYTMAAVFAGLTTLSIVLLSWFLPTAKVIGMCVWPLFCLAVYIAWHYKTSRRHFRFYLSMAAGCLGAAFVYHAGTNIEVTLKMTEAFILPAAAIVCVLLAVQRKQRAAIVLAASLILSCMTWGSLAHTIKNTYRHNGAALGELSKPVEMAPNTRPLLVHPARQAFVEWLRHTAQAAGWKAKTPLVCTSFYATGALYLLDARIVEASWQREQRYTPMSNYPKIFGHVPHALLKQAWILKPVNDGPRHMPQAALPLLGLPFPEGYDLVGTSPDEAIEGVWPAEKYQLWKPHSAKLPLGI